MLTDKLQNAILGQTIGCHPVSFLIQARWLRLFGHVARADSQQDYHRVISASLRPKSLEETSRAPAYHLTDRG